LDVVGDLFLFGEREQFACFDDGGLDVHCWSRVNGVGFSLHFNSTMFTRRVKEQNLKI
jgi:hypothetical protein